MQIKQTAIYLPGFVVQVDFSIQNSRKFLTATHFTYMGYQYACNSPFCAEFFFFWLFCFWGERYLFLLIVFLPERKMYWKERMKAKLLAGKKIFEPTFSISQSSGNQKIIAEYPVQEALLFYYFSSHFLTSMEEKLKIN